MRPMRTAAALLALSLVSLTGAVARADVPYPTCADAGCSDPGDFGSYLFLPPGQLPDDFDPAARGSWKYNPGTGMDVVGAWGVTTGRPDVVIAVLDSGIRWDAADVARKVALNAGELPPPPGCEVRDCNGDGFVSVDDYAGTLDANANGLLDGQDLIRAYSDGVDDDGNGYVDDIAGWDFFQDDNDPDDDVDYGHGTGEAEDSTGEADNGGGLPGVAPSAMFLPLRVGDSFVAIGSDFAQAVVYATDRRVALVQEALGTVSASAASQAAIDYAYRRGVPVIASAADESSRHHNFPAVLDHTVWMNSIVHGDGTIVEQTDVYDLMNGCTNYGGKAWVAISSNSCSSEATGRGAGLAALLVSHGRNLVDAHVIPPYPGLDAPFSAEEVRQLFRRAAQDVDHEADLDDLTMDGLLQGFLSAPPLGLFFGSRRFPTQAGWDQYTGYGRPDAPRLLDVTEETIPPEADLTGSLHWFDTVDPTRTPRVLVRGSAAAVRTRRDFDWRLEVGCGVQPKEWLPIDRGRAGDPLERAVLGEWSAGETAEACGFDPAVPISDPDAHTVTLRLQVLDAFGNLGEDRRTVAIHTDPSLPLGPLPLGASVEGAPTLVDVDRDGVLDVVVGTADGSVHVLRGATGEALPGFPARTWPLPIHPSPAYDSGEVPVPHEALIAPTAADDLDGDGRVEIVAASTEGRLYVFDDHGRIRPGFPVSTDPDLSQPSERDRLNDADPGIVGAPTLVDLDAPDGDPALEIVANAMDGHTYAWRADGRSVDGFPVRIADRTKVDVDPVTGKATPIAPGVRERGAKLVGSPAAGDLDGDGRPELVVTSNEEYEGEPNGFAAESFLLAVAVQLADELGGFSFDVGGRAYALHADGNRAPGGPFLPGWPARVPDIAPGLLPTVGTGVPGSPALADPDGQGLAAAIFATAGPAMLFDAAGASRLGTVGGVRRAFAADFPAGFPNVPATAGSADAPFFPALGSGAFGDVTGDGVAEYVAPTAGIRKLIDSGAAGEQSFSDHQIAAFDPRDGSLLPAFPRPMDDTQFLTAPSLADVDGDGVADILQGSGAYLVRAYRGDGSTPAGFPKFTHGWVLSAVTPGDVDGDGRVEVVAATREGRLYVWNTDGVAGEASIPWQGFARDRRNTGNLQSGVSPLAGPPAADPGLRWTLEGIAAELEARLEGAPPGVHAQLERALRALEEALYALDHHLSEALERSLWRACQALSGRAVAPFAADLRERLAAAIESGAEAMLAEACAGDGGCPTGARGLLRRARMMEAIGASRVALRWQVRALSDGMAGRR